MSKIWPKDARLMRLSCDICDSNKMAKSFDKFGQIFCSLNVVNKQYWASDDISKLIIKIGNENA